MALPVSAAVFTDFDSYASFTAGGNPVYVPGEAPGDYWIGEWSSATLMDVSGAAIEAGKGYKGSKALALWEDDMSNQGLYLFVTAGNGIKKDYTGTVYLRVWMDLTEVGFRKANFGVSDSSYALFTTDEENTAASEWPFYYMADGTTEWVKMLHGSDGCFGDAQESDVFGFKGFFAFPVSDFVIRENANPNGLEAHVAAANMADVTGIYLFWDYADFMTPSVKFYLDNIEFVADYKTFDGVLYEEPKAEETTAPAETSAAADTSAPADTASTPAETTAPTTKPAAAQTFDIMLIGLAAVAVSAAAFVANKSKKK